MRLIICDICGKDMENGYTDVIRMRKYDTCKRCHKKYNDMFDKAHKKVEKDFLKWGVMSRRDIDFGLEGEDEDDICE